MTPSPEAQALLEQGKRLFEQSRYDEALAAYNQTSELDPEWAEPWHQKGHVFEKQGRDAEALDAYNRALEFDPKLVCPWNGKGNLLRKQGRYAEALAAYEQAINHDRGWAKPWGGKGNVFDDQGSYAEAIAAYEQAIKRDPQWTYLWNNKGNVFAKQGRYAEALTAYDQAIERNPQDAIPWNNKGSVFDEQGSYAEALAAYEKAIERDPQFADPWNGKGNVFSTQGWYAEALAAYEQAIERDPKFAYPLNGKGNVFAEQNLYTEALAAYEQAIERDPQLAYPWNGKGNVFYKKGRYAEALAAYEQAITRDPQFAYAWNGKGNLFWAQRLHSEAVRCYRRLYHVAQHAQELIKALPSWLKRVEPLLAYRILFEEHPDWQALPQLGDLPRVTLEQCRDLLSLFTHLQSDACVLTPFEQLKLRGVLTFYGGDPLRTREMFDKVNLQDETDLLGQYYLVQSLRGFCEDESRELEFAVKQARAYLANHAANPEPYQMYYAGQILALTGNHAEAQICFQAVNHFLPALYMEMLMLHRQNNMEERDQRIETILEREHALHQQHRSGFLGSIPPLDLDEPEKFWDRAHFCELREAANVVWEWLDAYEQQRGTAHLFMFQLDHERPLAANQFKAFHVWRLSAEANAATQAYAAERLSDALTEAKVKLKKRFFNNFANLEVNLSETPEVNASLLGKFLDECTDIPGDPEAYHNLVLYYFLQRRISAESAVLLRAFLVLKTLSIQSEGQVFANRKVLTHITGATSSVLAGILQHYLPGWNLSEVLMLGLSVWFVPLTLNYLRERIEHAGSSNAPLTYENFETTFDQHINTLRQQSGSEFDDLYTLEGFDAWLQKRSDKALLTGNAKDSC